MIAPLVGSPLKITLSRVPDGFLVILFDADLVHRVRNVLLGFRQNVGP